MSKTSRRTFLMCGLLGGEALIAGCGGANASSDNTAASKSSGDTTTPTTPTTSPPAAVSPPPAQPLDWVLRSLVLTPSTASSLDLRASLPAGSPLGGLFSVDPSGAPLPPGVQLASNGMLTLTDSAPAGSTVGVVFAYTTP
jgi:hypothetical protein